MLMYYELIMSLLLWLFNLIELKTWESTKLKSEKKLCELSVRFDWMGQQCYHISTPRNVNKKKIKNREKKKMIWWKTFADIMHVTKMCNLLHDKLRSEQKKVVFFFFKAKLLNLIKQNVKSKT